MKRTWDSVWLSLKASYIPTFRSLEVSPLSSLLPILKSIRLVQITKLKNDLHEASIIVYTIIRFTISSE